MSSKNSGAPIGSYLEVSGGPRYYFTHPKLKSAFFVEGGVGAYNFRQNGFIDPSTQQTVDQINNTKAGINGGIGGDLALSKDIDITAKGKYNVVFTPNGSQSFVTTMAGLVFRFR